MVLADFILRMKNRRPTGRRCSLKELFK